MGNSKEQAKSKTKKDYEFIAQIAVAVILAVLVIYSGAKFFGAGGGIGGAAISGVSASEIIPTGVPAVYGSELGIRYDDISTSNSRLADATISKLGQFDNAITLTGSDLQKYIDIVLQISCEYCCGADSIIFSNGKASCGCAHSYAMRGLAKYLIKNHGAEFSDDEILEELGKWKVLFFPGIHATKAAVLKSKGIELNYINLASNKYRGIETGQQANGAMVGGC